MDQGEKQAVSLMLGEAEGIIASNLQEWINAFVRVPLKAGEHLKSMLRSACSTLLNELPPAPLDLGEVGSLPSAKKQERPHHLKARLVSHIEKAIDQLLEKEEEWQAEIDSSKKLIAQMDKLNEMNGNLIKLTSANRYNDLGSSKLLMSSLTTEKEMIRTEMKEKQNKLKALGEWALEEDGFAATIIETLEAKGDELKRTIKVFPVRWTGWLVHTHNPSGDLEPKSVADTELKCQGSGKMIWNTALSEIQFEPQEEGPSLRELERVSIEVDPYFTTKVRFFYAGGRTEFLEFHKTKVPQGWQKTIEIGEQERLVKIKVKENPMDFNFALAKVE